MRDRVHNGRSCGVPPDHVEICALARTLPFGSISRAEITLPADEVNGAPQDP